MERRSKKAIVCLVTVSGVVVVVAAGLAFKRPLLEQWYLWQVESGNEKEKAIALERLEEMGSVKAVPHLLELILDAQVAQAPDVSQPPALMKYNVSDLLRGVSKSSDFAIREALIDLVWEIVRSEGTRPRFDHDLAGQRDGIFVSQSRQEHEAVQKGLGIFRQTHARIGRLGVGAVPEFNRVLVAEDTERLVKLVADLELRLLIDDLKIQEDIHSLTSLLANDSLAPEVHGYVIVSIGEIAEKATFALPLLTDALRNESPQNRMHAADALREIGPGARAAVPILRTLSQHDENHYVRRAAADALRTIEGGSE